MLSEPDPASGMAEPAPNKDGNGHKSTEETLGRSAVAVWPIISKRLAPFRSRIHDLTPKPPS